MKPKLVVTQFSKPEKLAPGEFGGSLREAIIPKGNSEFYFMGKDRFPDYSGKKKQPIEHKINIEYGKDIAENTIKGCYKLKINGEFLEKLPKITTVEGCYNLLTYYMKNCWFESKLKDKDIESIIVTWIEESDLHLFDQLSYTDITEKEVPELLIEASKILIKKLIIDGKIIETQGIIEHNCKTYSNIDNEKKLLAQPFFWSIQYWNGMFHHNLHIMARGKTWNEVIDDFRDEFLKHVNYDNKTSNNRLWETGKIDQYLYERDSGLFSSDSVTQKDLFEFIQKKISEQVDSDGKKLLKDAIVGKMEVYKNMDKKNFRIPKYMIMVSLELPRAYMDFTTKHFFLNWRGDSLEEAYLDLKRIIVPIIKKG